MKHRFCMSAIVSLMMGVYCFSSNAMMSPIVFKKQLENNRNDLFKFSFALQVNCDEQLKHINTHDKCAPQMTEKFMQLQSGITNDLRTNLSVVLLTSMDKETCSEYGLSTMICKELQSKGNFNYDSLAGVTDAASLEAACEAAAKTAEPAAHATSVLQCLAYIAESVEHGTLLNTYGESTVTASATTSPLSGVYSDYKTAIGKLILATPHDEKFIPLITQEQINTEAAKFGIDITKPNEKYQIVNDVVYRLNEISLKAEDRLLTNMRDYISFASISGYGRDYLVCGMANSQQPLNVFTIDPDTRKLSKYEHNISIAFSSGGYFPIRQFASIGKYMVFPENSGASLGMITINESGQLVRVTEDVPEGFTELYGIAGCAGVISSSNGDQYLIFTWASDMVPCRSLQVYKYEAATQKLIRESSKYDNEEMYLSEGNSNLEKVSGTITNGDKSYIIFTDRSLHLENRPLNVYGIGDNGDLYSVKAENNGGHAVEEILNRRSCIFASIGKYFAVIGGKNKDDVLYEDMFVYTIDETGYFVKGGTYPLNWGIDIVSWYSCGSVVVFKAADNPVLAIFNHGIGEVQGYTIDKNNNLMAATINGTCPVGGGQGQAAGTIGEYIITSSSPGNNQHTLSAFKITAE